MFHLSEEYPKLCPVEPPMVSGHWGWILKDHAAALGIQKAVEQT